jgi:hypothetical protein
MNGARFLEVGDRFEQSCQKIEVGDWVASLAPWQAIAHMTFSWEASVWSGQRVYENFMRSRMRGVSYFYALEQNPGRDGFHVHALWCDCRHRDLSGVWREWFSRYGRNRLEFIRNASDVADYCAKYVCKEGAWWDVKLFEGRRPGGFGLQ